MDWEYFINKNIQKYYYYQTNQITYFNKCVTLTVEKKYANIKWALKNTLTDLPEVVKIIQKMLENEPYKIHFQHISNKNRNIKAILNISLFCHLKHKISKHALYLMVSYARKVNVITVLFQCIRISNKTLSLFYKQKIQKSY